MEEETTDSIKQLLKAVSSGLVLVSTSNDNNIRDVMINDLALPFINAAIDEVVRLRLELRIETELNLLHKNILNKNYGMIGTRSEL